ncbi:MAG TPA: prephenate dehydrogenase [Microlunatus sp.]
MTTAAVPPDPGHSGRSRPVLITGTGLIGASIGCALTADGWSVHLRDRRSSHAQVAESLGAGSCTVPDPAAVGLVVVAVPPRALPEVIGRALRDFPTAAVTDVGSVKAGVLDSLWADPGLAADLERYVGSHPMAGSQHSGPMTARADLFRDRTWVITPHRRSAPWAVDAVSELAAACGARAVTMDVVDHDAAVARVSHLPHLLSVLMAGHLNSVPDRDLRLAGQGLRDVTRVAASDPELWEQIMTANSAAVLAELRSVRHQLDTVIAALDLGSEGGTGDGLRAQLERGVAGSRRIPGKHGAPATAYGEVVVEIPDAPGALGRLFADIGDAGVNVEDVSIEHDQNRQVGYLSVAVAPAQLDRLVARMVEHGWDVQP